MRRVKNRSKAARTLLSDLVARFESGLPASAATPVAACKRNQSLSSTKANSVTAWCLGGRSRVTDLYNTPSNGFFDFSFSPTTTTRTASNVKVFPLLGTTQSTQIRSSQDGPAVRRILHSLQRIPKTNQPRCSYSPSFSPSSPSRPPSTALPSA